MKLFNIFPIAFMALALLASCEKNDADTQKPQIEVISPAEEQQIRLGDAIVFNVKFSDNEELKSYKVDIHSNFDAHTHKLGAVNDSVAWTFQKSWDFPAGMSQMQIQHQEIVVPAVISEHPVSRGEYHITIYCTDASGNEHWMALPIDVVSALK